MTEIKWNGVEWNRVKQQPKWMDEWMSEQTNKWMSKRMSEWIK